MILAVDQTVAGVTQQEERERGGPGPWVVVEALRVYFYRVIFHYLPKPGEPLLCEALGSEEYTAIHCLKPRDSANGNPLVSGGISSVSPWIMISLSLCTAALKHWLFPMKHRCAQEGTCSRGCGFHAIMPAAFSEFTLTFPYCSHI